MVPGESEGGAELDGSLLDDFGKPKGGSERRQNQGGFCTLKKEEYCAEFRGVLPQALSGSEDLPDGLESAAEVERATAKKVFDISSGRRKDDKETW